MKGNAQKSHGMVSLKGLPDQNIESCDQANEGEYRECCSNTHKEHWIQGDVLADSDELPLEFTD